MNDEPFLREAIRLAREHMLAGDGGPFGAVIVRDGEVIARGWNRVATTNDPTAHAKVVAIREACARAGNFWLKGCVLYASCEPCPMCLAAIYWARMERLVFAASREDASKGGFDDEFLHRELSLPLEARNLPTRQALRAEARVIFSEWMALPTRIPY